VGEWAGWGGWGGMGGEDFHVVIECAIVSTSTHVDES